MFLLCGGLWYYKCRLEPARKEHIGTGTTVEPAQWNWYHECSVPRVYGASTRGTRKYGIQGMWFQNQEPVVFGTQGIYIYREPGFGSHSLDKLEREFDF